MQLLAGRVGQEHNRRKNRKGAFWEDRYHATAIETGEHLCRCLVYLDLNMVRAGVVSHPAEWEHGGYNEIQQPRQRKSLIHYDELCSHLGIGNYELLRESHRGWIEEALKESRHSREEKWTQSIAVGSRNFVEKTKEVLGVRAKGRKAQTSSGEACELREPQLFYQYDYASEKQGLSEENDYYWEDYVEISG